MRHGTIVTALLCLGAVGCNCDGNTVCTYLQSNSSTATTASAAGIWSGTDSSTGLGVRGLIDADGDADFIRSDGVQYVGTVQVNGSALEVALNGYTQFGYQFADGSTQGIGTLNATVVSTSSLSGTLQFTTSDNTSSTSTWSLTFNSLYDTASSLAAVAGTYLDTTAAVTNGLDPLSGAGVTLSSSGVLYAQGSSNGCVANGSVSVESSGYDLYRVSYTLSNCNGEYAVLNGVAFSGLAELDATASPAQLTLAVSGESSSATYYGIVSQLTVG